MTAMLLPLNVHDTGDGWVTFARTKLPSGVTLLTQKRDGSTRTITLKRRGR